MWTKTKSLFLSRILTCVVAGIFFILTFFVPGIAEWYSEISNGKGLLGGDIVIPICVGLYVAEILGFSALWQLYRLLENINREQIFIDENTRCLRIISWSCMFAGVSFAAIGLWRFVFLMPSIMAVMFGLIMRVLKNVFEKAVEIKSENDFTI